MDVLMPQLGETVAEGKITQWFKSAGDAVKPGDNLFEIETDKVSMEVPATTAGVLAEIRVPAGEVAPVGAVVAVIADGAAASAPAAAEALSKPAVAPAAPPANRLQPTTAPVAAGEPAAAAIKLDPFFEVRTPERNYGPARLPGGSSLPPLAPRRRCGGPPGTAASGRATSGPPRALRRRWRRAQPQPPVSHSPRVRAPKTSRRSTATCRSKRCRSTACARPSPPGWCRRSRPSRIST